MAASEQDKALFLFRYPWLAAFACVSTAAILAYYHAWTFLTIIVLIMLGFYFFKPAHNYSLWGAALLIAALIYFSPAFAPLPKDLPEINDAVVIGEVASIPKTADGRTRFILKTKQDNKLHHRYQVVCRFNVQVQKGDQIGMSGSLQPPRRPGNPGEFDYRKYLYHQGIFYLLSVKEADDVRIIEAAGGWQGGINRYREQMRRVTDQYLIAQEAVILRGMLLGETDGMDPELYKEFQNTGIVHLFSVSGLHIGFLLLLSAWISSWLGARRSYKFTLGITLLLVYGTLISWPVPVIRASIMGGMGLLAYYSGRPHQMLNSLGISGLIIILIDPHALFSISFQLSFVATWGLIYLFPLLRERIPYSGLGKDALLVPLCAQLAVIPLIAYYFNLMSPVSVLANLLVTYLSGGVVIFGFVALALALIPPLAAICLLPAGLMIEFIIKATHFCNSLPGGVLWVATPEIWQMVFYYAGLLLLVSWPFSSYYYRCAFYAGVLAILVFLTSVFWPPAWRDRGLMEIVFIDVGQGDSILIKSPQGRFILVDGGGSMFYKVGEMKLLPYLRHRGINRLDMVINTHPDSDHLLGLTEVVEEIKVKCFAYPLVLQPSPDYKEIFELAQQQSAALIGMQAGQVIQMGQGFYLEVLYPQPQKADLKQTNHFSLVLRCRYGASSVLLLGDLDKEGIKQLMEQKVPLKSEVVKIPHHGSSSSLAENFYSSCGCHWAVISVGDNQFGHPHQEVIDVLVQDKIAVYRTDQHGTIRYCSDGCQSSIEGYIKE